MNRSRVVAILALAPAVYLCAGCAPSGERVTPQTPGREDASIREAIRMLQSENAEERLAGIANLWALPARAIPAVPSLIEVLAESSALPPEWTWYPWVPAPPSPARPPTPAESAATVLMRIGGRSVPSLITALGDDRATLRGNAAWVLGKIGDPRAAQPVLGLLGDRDAFVRCAAVLALGTAPNWKVASNLRDLLNNEDGQLRALAAAGLGRRIDLRSIDRLTRLLPDRDLLVQDAAAWALGEIGTNAAVGALLAYLQAAPSEQLIRVLSGLKDPRITAPMTTLVGHPDWQISRSATHALGVLGDRRAAGRLVAVLKGHDQASRQLKPTATWALGEIGAQEAVPALIEALGDGRIEVRREAASALGRLRARAAVEPLIPLLERDEVHGCDVFAQAAEALGEIGDRRAVEPLIEALKHKEPYYLRQAVVLALGKLGDPRAGDPLIDCLKDVHGPNPLTHMQYYREIGHALKEIGGRDIPAGLARLAESDNVYWRCAAIGAYGGMGAETPLLEALDNENPRVRRMATWELRETGGARAVRALKRLLLCEQDEAVIRDAQQTLKTIEAKKRKIPRRR